ncbi:MAG: rRNA pseudouridine synthase [Planctomycetota bacterium]|nr:MAG: rRNA pseudouridine synthase [Planctomycetota bacterium]
MSRRLDAWLASCGLGSRSETRILIRKGQVQVNGETTKQLALQVGPDDLIEIAGKPVIPPRSIPLTLLLHKPLGYSCSHDVREQPIIDDLLTQWSGHSLNSVGRLDRDTSGLLVLTDDGQLLHRLIHPKRKVPKRYRMTYRGTLDPRAVEFVAAGLQLPDEDKPCLPARLELQQPGAATMILHEGRYHQVRRMIQALGGEVETLHRDAVGSLRLPADLAPGELREIREDELALLQGLDSPD